MKKLILILLVVSGAFLFAQEKENQSVELPEFVITGVQNIDIPIQKKKRPQLVSTLSGNFLNPTYPSDSFLITDLSSPQKDKVELFRENKNNSGLLKLGAGLNYLPTGEFYIAAGTKNFLFTTNLFGSNIRDFVDYSDYNESGAKLGLDFFVSSNSDFFPGLSISMEGMYYRNNYNFYGSINPSYDRETQKTITSVKISNFFNNRFKYKFDLAGRLFELKDISLKENFFDGKTFLEFNLDGFGIKFNGEYKLQSLSNFKQQDFDNNFYNASGGIFIKPSDSFLLFLGTAFTKQDSNDYFSPNASFVARFGKGLSLTAGYTPHAEFTTFYDMFLHNRFFIVGDFQNIFSTYRDNINASLIYQYDKYFEINTGFKYANIENYFYFEDFINPGYFEVQVAEEAEKLTAFLNFLFHLGPFGEFYSNTNFNLTTNTDDDFIPYHPKVSSNLIYAYQMENGFSFRTKFNISLETYTDISNNEKMPNYINLGFSLGYNFSESLKFTVDLNNLLFRKNFIYNLYEDKPFDALLGIEYRW
ncbi:MAG: TonB-dependent receptor [Ignavibacteria bacterium]|jgi:hypothetical protein